MDGSQARQYFIVYKALVGAAYIQASGMERAYSLSRAWSYYARPVIDTLWYPDSDPVAVETAHQLLGWLLWLHDVSDPELVFRELYQECQARRPMRTLGSEPGR